MIPLMHRYTIKKIPAPRRGDLFCVDYFLKQGPYAAQAR